MILNAYAVLDLFLSLLRLVSALAVLGLGLAAWRKCTSAKALETRQWLEEHGYLLFLLAFLLLGLNVASWPILYLLLQSYVPEWPGVMCIYGVKQIGTGTVGVAQYLPILVKALQVAKPALVFLSGAWFVLYLVNRRSRTAPLFGRVITLLVLLGMLALADAAIEVGYLAIPKREEFLSAGCCTEAFEGDRQSSRFLPTALLQEGYQPWLYAIYYGVNGGMVLALFSYLLRGPSHQASSWLGVLLLAAVISIPVNALFLIEIAAPALLHLPYHHCPYDLVPQVPESLLAIALFFAGCFAVGWACIVAWFGNVEETSRFLPGMINKLLGLALLCYLASLVMISVELMLA
jgi:hypothetical protein